MALVLIISIVLGVLLIAVGVPLGFLHVPPNRWYSLRAGRALTDDEAWQAANRASGRGLVLAGGAVITAAIVNVALGANAAVAVLVNSVVGTLGVILAVAAGFAAMSKGDF